MAAISEYILHLYSAIVTPNDHSGEGVWNVTEDMPIRGCQRNEHYAFDGISIQKPPGLTSIRYGVYEIEGQQFKCGVASFPAWEHDEQETFADTLTGKEARDYTIATRGWAVDETGRSVNLETRIYWAKLMNAERIEFAIFAAAITRIDDNRATVPAQYMDYAKSNAKAVETPAGRLQSMETGSLVPRQIGRGSPELIQQQTLNIG